MQPTLPQAGTADMDLTAVQSMDWLFKKEQMYLLAQFWQQRATLAEKEVNTLKEQLSTNHPTDNADDEGSSVAATNNIPNITKIGATFDATNTDETISSNITQSTVASTAITGIATTPPNSKLLLSPTTPNATALNNNNQFNNNNTKLLNSVAAAITLHQNGGNSLLATTTPSPSPPLSDSGSNLINSQLHPLNGVNGCINTKLLFNHAQQMMMEAAAAAAAAAAAVQQQQQQQQQQQNSPIHSPNDQREQQQATTTNIDDNDNDNDDGDSKSLTALTAEMKISKPQKQPHQQQRIKESENLANDEEEHNIVDEDNNDDDNIAGGVDVNDRRIGENVAIDDRIAVVGDNVERTDDTSINISNNNNNSYSQNSKNYKKIERTNSMKKRSSTRKESENEVSTQSNDAIGRKQTIDDVDSNANERDSRNAGSVDGKDQDGNDNDDIDEDESGRAENTETINSHAELLAAKDKEIKALIEEVQRLRALEQTQLVQIHRLEEHLEAKRQHIIRLEAHLDKQQINAALADVVKDASRQTFEQISEHKENEEDDDDVALASDVAKENMHVVDDDDDDDDEEVVDDSTEQNEIIKTHSKSNESPNAEHKIKKENQNALDLDTISQQSAIAAAVAAAACGNDPNKFQELLLERTKALAEARKNSEATPPNVDVDDKNKATESPNSEADIVEKVLTKKPKIEIIDDDEENVANTVECSKPNKAIPPVATSATTSKAVEPSIDVDALEPENASKHAEPTPPPKNFKPNFENFSNLLGEDFVNNYWRRGFGDLPPTAAMQQQQHAMLLPNLQHQTQQQQNLHMHQQHQNSPLHHHNNQHHHQHHFQQQQSQQTQQQQHGPSSTTLLSQLVNSTFANSTTTNSSNSSSLRTDAMQHHYHHHHHQTLHQQHQLSLAERAAAAAAAATELEKSNVIHHDSSSSASTPNLHDQRSNDELHQQHQSHNNNPLNGGSITNSASRLCKSEDNNNSLCATPTNPTGLPPHHLQAGFLPGLPFQFQERSHYRFADDLQLPPGASMAGRLGESLIPKGDPMEAKLQEMLRYNMDKYANQALDTLHISRRVRELLSVHNIGQRLFAKYILGLSQGTVSELLSKPKPWDKLTEKGRDSYRKMHAWGCDDNAVMLLKSLIPKKDSGLPPYGGRSDDSMSDDRIAHLLNEASSLIKNSTPNALQQMKDEQQRQLQQDQNARRSVNDESLHSHEDSKSPHQHCTSPFYKDQAKSQDATQSPQSQQQQQQQQQQHQQQQQQQRLRAESAEMTPDKLARIYQELMARAPREAAFPGGGMPPSAVTMATGNAFPAAAAMAADENIRLAFEREMAKFQQQQQQNAATAAGLPNFPNFSSLMALQQQVLNGAAQDLTLTKEALNEHKLNGQRMPLEHSSASLDSHSVSGSQTPGQNKELTSNSLDSFSMHGRCKTETPVPPLPQQQSMTSSNVAAAPNTTNSAAPSPLSNSILPPAMTSSEDFSAAASPLQRMASITNSLITQPPVTPHHSQPQRPTKAVLPPITQQQFDMFNNLNTEDIVRRVKEALSQYSISQRLFGESVLGLSQGSVSDLLARPKPWHMLTQKGREPFIRMKMFLEDENAVHKLVASQYKIAPEKLMRTGSYSGSPQIPQGLANKMQAAALPMQKMMNELKLQEPAQAQHIMQQMQAVAMSAMQQQHQPHQQQQSQQAAAAVQAAQAAFAAQQHHQSMLLTSPGLPPQHAISLPAANAPNSSEKKPMLMPIHSPHQANAMRNMHQHMSPTVYEMAALTQDLDTQVITTKIKEALLANNIGQKIFGEAVLGLSQGSVSELLSKPKPWHMLSIKGREPFIRMQLWLSDANNVERLQLLKNERREASKRRRSTGPNQQDNSSDTSSNDTNDFYTSSPGPGSVGSSVSGAPPNKKQRVLFSEEQKEALRLAFTLDPYPNVGTIEFLATELGLATRTITNWFHNHRMRLKQQVPHGQPGAENQIPTRENTNATPFDPRQFRILLQQRLIELHKERMGLSGAPIHYPPTYFAAAALIGRSFANLPGAAGEPDLHALNQAFKEQMKGLDLSMGALKPERGDDFEDDLDGSHLSDNESLDGGETGDDKSSADYKDTPRSSLAASYLANARSSRRKAAAPQWVNPASTTIPTSEGDRNINGIDAAADSTADGNLPGTVAESDVASEIGCNKTHDNDASSVLEPEVHIKQEKDDGDSEAELAGETNLPATINAADTKEDKKIKVVGEEKLRMVRLANRLSNDDEASAPQAAAAWNY